MQAQAERERQARVILGDSERKVAEKFAEAGKTHDHNPMAFHLRAMNMLYEGLKQNSTIVIVPSTAVESMQLGGLAGLTALTMGLGQERANGQKEAELKRESWPWRPASGQTAIRSSARRSIGEAWILDEEKKKIVGSLEHATGSADLQPEQTLGDRIEDRGSQITFSGLGQHPPLEEKREWDPRKSRAYFRRN
jgi:hypothetical protein